MELYLILLMTFIVVFIVQQNLITKKDYNNKYEEIFDKIKVPIVITCFVGIAMTFVGQKDDLIVHTTMPDFIC